MHQGSSSSSQTKSQQEEGAWTPSLTQPAAIGSRWLLDEGRVIVNGVASGGSATLQWKATHPAIHRWHKLDSVDVERGHKVGWVRMIVDLGGGRERRNMVRTHSVKFSKISCFKTMYKSVTQNIHITHALFIWLVS